MKSLTRLLVASVVSVAAVSHAQVLLPGGVVSGPGLDNQVSLGGSFTQLPDLQIFNDSANLVGGLLSGVITGDAGNPHGGLTFVYSVSNVGSDAVQALSLPGFSGLSLTVLESAGLGTIEPAAASRSAGLGNDVSFFFAAPIGDIPATQGSTWILVHTDATAFGTLSAAVVGPNGSTTVNVFAPVPEPTTMAAVVGVGLLGLAVWRRRQA